MAISQNKYINIISGIGGQPQVSNRDLMGRVFTENVLVPVDSVVEFSGGAIIALEAVGEYFGTTSVEYTIAKKYFGFISKKGMQPAKISFGRLVKEAVPATLYGNAKSSTLSQLKEITTGTLAFDLNGETKTVSNLNFSSATSLANVAEKVTTAFTTGTIGAKCEYVEDTSRFVIKTTATGADNSLSLATGDVAVALGLSNGILSEGSNIESAEDSLKNSVSVSNNFFSFMFVPELTASDMLPIATWVQSQNVRYMYSITAIPETVDNILSVVDGFDGVSVTLDKFNSYAGFMPMCAISAVDYTKANASINLMYQQFNGVEPSVTNTEEARGYDTKHVNYYGSTQQAGQEVSFYQDGVLLGSIRDMGVFASEAWLKDDIFANLLNLRLSLDTLPANDTGKGLVIGSLMRTINMALYNGVILAGKELDTVKKAYITQLTNDSEAWQSVQNNGFYLDVNIETYTENEVEKYKISYKLVYSKGDSVNYVSGSNILI